MTQKTSAERIMEHKPGAVELLCREIGARFEPGMETVAMLRAFVAVLVGQIDEMRHWQQAVAHVTGNVPSGNAIEAIRLAQIMVGQPDAERLIARAAEVHDFCHIANPDDAYPTDHTIDMISSCASALRFGLEIPCQSRHAASAVEHIWRIKYGVTLHDSLTPAWGHEWARVLLQRAFLLQIAQAEAGAKVLRDLVMLARTSGGTAGRDDELCAACDRAEAFLQPLT